MRTATVPAHVDKLFEHYPIARLVPKAGILKALANAKVLNLKAGTTVFRELQACHAFPFILKGNIRVMKRSEQGREITLYNVAPGDACVVSAACLLGNKPYNALGLVQSDCQLVAMPGEDFDALMSIKVFREFIFSLFSKRVLGLMQLVDEIAFQKLDQRLAKFLLDNGPNVTISHQALADELGTVREMITRLLNNFADRGMVELKRGSVRVRNPLGLQTMAEISSPM